MWRLFLGLLFLSSTAVAKSNSEATIVGSPYLGVPNTTVSIEFDGNICVLKSLGNVELQRFSIVLTCNASEQLLWSENLSDYEVDDPRFELLWAGDNDGDGKLDLKMEVSPKYSCSQIAYFNSSLADVSKLVGSGIFEKIACG
ncbi:hypothetical protein [Vibrio parahaemolyticus]|uniref:hypothetical protein n=1 Tax=Vibrio parahaemolyticus TaxID=670 RepID=UPI0004708508|nr:hypothetical protein [Vibrio parahaemolyticus]EMA2439055.1 hypothetical protein [Vibrio parahaemolyticus]MBE3867417.1 hypothetical protein [Vibrio parahaemolyticus]MCQ9048966.1 hypothetical protein [Vibrio parahaemolyticus]MCZ5880713.1 hypothetical protein [Vibrio parahaemolyticus]MCZ6372233.1 hypothetical protein [Vibrio parahaemolyticus]